jgi:hypothetical protein
MAAILGALIPLISALLSGSGAASAISAALLPSLSTAFAGTAITSALEAITLSQWVTIGVDLAENEPTIAAGVRKLFAGLHPALARFVVDLETHMALNPSATAAEIAGRNLALWFAANAPKTIPGYLPDGSVGPIPNPDLKGK